MPPTGGLAVRVRHLVRKLFRRNIVERDLDLEVESYYEMLVSEKELAGLSTSDARREALLEIGGREQVKETVRDVWIGSWCGSVARDLRYGARSLLRNPALTATIVLSLGLGLGATSAVFSLADSMLLRPLPVPDAASVVTVGTDALGEGTMRSGRLSYPNYLDLRERVRSLAGLIAFDPAPFSFARSRDDVRQRLRATLVSDNYFRVLGVEPIIGRGFALDEGRVPGRDALVVLAHEFWENALGADQSVLGSNLLINGIEFTVIGVAPAGFRGLHTIQPSAFFVPLSMAHRLDPGSEDPLENREWHSYVYVKGRLAPGFSIDSARAELATRWQSLEQQYPDANRNRTIAVRSEVAHRIRHSPPDAIVAALLAAFAFVVLIIACSNVSNLLLGRASERAREIAVRLALGSGRLRLFRQLVTEGLVLSVLGTAAGIGFAYLGVQLFRTIPMPADIAPLGPQLDARVLILSLSVGVLSVGIFGLAPAWHSIRTQLAP